MRPAAAPPSPYWSRPAAALLAELDSGPGGLTGDRAQARMRAEGPNQVHQTAAVPALRLLLRQFQSPLVLILVFAALISGVLRQWIDAAIILAMVLGSTLLGFFQEHRASRAVAALRQRLALIARVRRDGREQDIPFAAIVRGDVVLLRPGDMVPADAVLLSGNGLQVSEAALTGESFPVEKKPGPVAADAGLPDRLNCVWLGTSVRSGSAEVLVVAVGRATAFGEIAERLKEKPQESDFARGVRHFGTLLLQVMIGMVLFMLIINQLLGRPFIDSLLFSVALGLGMSPELLPAIISITLSAGATRLAKKGVIVRKLEAIENLGGMTVFCTDKTGTLTEGLIGMVGAVDPAGAPSEAVRRLGFVNATLEDGVANPLDQAVLADGRAGGLTAGGWRKHGEIPYDFIRKRLSVVVSPPRAAGETQGEGAETRLMLLKGAVDPVLDICATVATPEGEAPIDAAAAGALQAFAAQRGREGLRLLAVATRRLPVRDHYDIADEAGMRLEGFLVFRDPPKPEAASALGRLAALGVTVKVISGDNRHVVRRVAEQVGLTGTGLLTGAEIAAMPDVALQSQAEQATLFAEIDPQQKERIIRALQRRGHSVGYLGDGINDAPALYAADVGISVDQAVDVARESADVVLLDRDLGVLCDGVEGGRRTFANTLKYISITTSANFGNMISMAVAAPLLPFLPMIAKQILLNNFLSDFPAMAISTDTVDDDRLLRSQRMSIGDIRRFMIVFGLISSVFDLAAFALLLKVFKAGEPVFQTAWFVLSLLTELAVVMLLRTERPVWRSRPGGLLAAISAGVGLLALALPCSGPVARLFGLTPLGAGLMGTMLLLAVGYLVMTELVKRWFFRRWPPGGAASGATAAG